MCEYFYLICLVAVSPNPSFSSSLLPAGWVWVRRGRWIDGGRLPGPGLAGQPPLCLCTLLYCWPSPWHSKTSRKISVLVLQSSSGTRSFLNRCLGEVTTKMKIAILVRSSEIATWRYFGEEFRGTLRWWVEVYVATRWTWTLLHSFVPNAPSN